MQRQHQLARALQIQVTLSDAVVITGEARSDDAVQQAWSTSTLTMATADAAFLAEVENFLSSGELPSIDVKMKPSLLLPDWSISTMHPTRQSQTLVDSTQSKREVERMKDRERRRAYRARKRGEREHLRNEIERLTKELEKTKASEFESEWKALAERQLAARLQSEAEQKHLYQAIRVQVKLAQDFQRLVYVRLNGLDDLPTIEPPEQFGASSRKRIRLESCDTEIFAAFARELGGVYARTDSTLETWGLASTEANWDAPFQSWNENVDTGFFQFRGKITMPFNYRDICQYRWYAAHLFHRQDGRELYQQVDDPDNTRALKYRVTTSLSSGELATALQRIVIRRYEENARMVLAWRCSQRAKELSSVCIPTRRAGALPPQR
ncbi:hypothetical protein ON010_g5619 [Phytophthora cinnamomi]|nr:hypothetical protein ON010_g5619 [Phytophthora cinnamomi]